MPTETQDQVNLQDILQEAVGGELTPVPVDLSEKFAELSRLVGDFKQLTTHEQSETPRYISDAQAKVALDVIKHNNNGFHIPAETKKKAADLLASYLDQDQGKVISTYTEKLASSVGSIIANVVVSRLLETALEVAVPVTE